MFFFLLVINAIPGVPMQGAAIVSGLNTVGTLVAKSLTSGVSGIPSYSGNYSTFNPVVPLDVFLVQVMHIAKASFVRTSAAIFCLCAC